MVVGFWGGGNEIEREARVCKNIGILDFLFCLHIVFCESL